MTSVKGMSFTFSSECETLTKWSFVVLVISWIFALAFDIIVFTLTVLRTTRIIGRQRTFRLNSSLGSVMRRDSMFSYYYFLFIARLTQPTPGMIDFM